MIKVGLKKNETMIDIRASKTIYFVGYLVSCLIVSVDLE